mgnify:FL=1
MRDKILKHLPKILSVLLLAGLVLAYFFIPEAQQFFDEAWKVLSGGGEEEIKNWVASFGWAGPVVLILAMIVQMFLIVIPSVALMVVCILAYGPVWGSLLVALAISCASTVGYFLGRKLGDGVVKNLVGSSTEDKLEDFLNDYGFWAIAITRLNPFLSNDAISFVGGILKMNYLKFLGATLAGIAPLTLFIAIMGESSDGLENGLLWGSIVSVIIFALYVYWSKKRKKSKK